MEEINNKKKGLTTDELEDVSGGFYVAYDPNDIAKDSHAMANKLNQAGNVNSYYRSPSHLFKKFADLFQLNKPKGPNGSGNGGR